MKSKFGATPQGRRRTRASLSRSTRRSMKSEAPSARRQPPIVGDAHLQHRVESLFERTERTRRAGRNDSCAPSSLSVVVAETSIARGYGQHDGLKKIAIRDGNRRAKSYVHSGMDESLCTHCLLVQCEATEPLAHVPHSALAKLCRTIDWSTDGSERPERGTE